MMSMWKDEDVTPDMLVFSGMDAKKQVEAGIVIKERMRQSDEEEKRQETAESSVVRQEMAGYNAAMKERGQSESGGQQPVQSESAMLAGKSEMVQTDCGGRTADSSDKTGRGGCRKCNHAGEYKGCRSSS